MKLSKRYTTVTTLSKTIAFILFILLPFIGFYLGMEYQKRLDVTRNTPYEIQMKYSAPSQTP